MKRAVIYARVSTERQAEEGLSIDSQIASCRDKAEQLGATVLHVFRDDGITGTTDARPGFRTAINRCATGDVDYLICWSSSRFARDQHDAISYKRELRSYGTKVVYAQSALDLDSHEGWMLDSFQQVMDESYSRQVAADTKRSMIKAASEGFFMGGRVPYGYDAVPACDDGRRRRLVPRPGEAEVIAQIFDWARAGIGTLLIARRLNEQGVSMRGGRPWHKGTVNHILNSEVYMGIVIYGRIDRKTRRPRPPEEWTRVNSHQPLVSAEVFSLVQEGMGARQPREDRAAPNSNHVFTGLLRCGLCGSSLQIATGTGRGGKVYSYYACRGDLQGCACEFKRMRADQFDRWMLDQLLDKLLTRETIQGVLDKLDEAAARWVKDRAARRAALVIERRAVESRRNNILDAIEAAGGQTAGLNEMLVRLKDLGERINLLDKQLTAIENEQEPVLAKLEVSAEEAAAIFRETIANCDDPKTLRSYVATIAQMIVVRATEVVVHYKPECLVQMDGTPVHSKHNWLPVSGRLRTAVLTIQRGPQQGMADCPIPRAA